MDDLKLKIEEVIRPNTIDLNLSGLTEKDEIIEYLAGLLDEAGLLNDKQKYIESVHEREQLGPTYMEHFIAIPHGKCDAVCEAGIAFGRSSEGIMYETSLGGGIAKLIFMLAIPNRVSADAYMAVLARLARLLMHEEFREELMSASSYEDVVKAIRTCEGYLED
jgi:fructose-specific phosphotransferase system IIA component